MVPAAFQSRRVLKVLNVAAVGFALAAAVSAVFAAGFGRPGLTAIVTGLPTWIIGTFWALVLRWPKTVGDSSFRWGWAMSVPLAVLNSSVAAGLLFALDRYADPSRFLVGALLGATVGALFWIPALIATMVCFGVPIASAQRLAKKGLAGEERGEWIVGIACVVMSVLGLLISLGTPVQRFDSFAPGAWITRAFALLGLAAGGAATVFARAREARRRQFVADAEAGKTPGYRVDATDEGKVLVRVVSQGEGYRVADFEEELFELDAQGEAMRPKRLEA